MRNKVNCKNIWNKEFSHLIVQYEIYEIEKTFPFSTFYLKLFAFRCFKF
jgi:hypothetical protein